MKYSVEVKGLFERFFAWLARRMPNERQRLLAVTIVAGGLCGLAAVAFHLSIALAGDAADQSAPTAAPGHSWIWWTILTPALRRPGGRTRPHLLGAGGGGQRHSPGEGGLHLSLWLITIRETIGKFVLCAFQIGTGASLGVEGPTVQICAGVSSMLARVARLSPKNRGAWPRWAWRRALPRRSTRPLPPSPSRWKS